MIYKLRILFFVFCLSLGGQGFAQSEVSTKNTTVQSANAVSTRTISDDFSELWNNPRFRQFLIFLIVVYLGYRRFRKRKLKERNDIEITKK